jgi:hypothetical protein
LLKRWPAFAGFLDDGRICLTNNAAERALRGIAIGRKAWLFAGSDRGGERAVAMFTLIETAKLNGIDPQAWLTDVLTRINDHPGRQARRTPTLEMERPDGQTGGMNPAGSSAAFDSFNEIATVRIELRDSDLVIWRQVGVPTSITLKVLHNVIQAAMGWFDYHLWEFTIAKRRYGLPMDQDWEPNRAPTPARSACARC